MKGKFYNQIVEKISLIALEKGIDGVIENAVNVHNDKDFSNLYSSLIKSKNETTKTR